MSPKSEMAFIDRRKRSREDEEYCDVPLSKRINNLHLTNFEEGTCHNTMDYPNHLVNREDTYSPELTEAENPYYYVKNKLLHELHLERLKRCPV